MFLPLLALLCLPFTDTGSDSIKYDLELEQVVVTGTRTKRLLKDVPVQTRVINASDIRKADATNIQDLLQQELPGVEFTYTMSQHASMNLSGFAGQSVLVLMDGERLSGDTQDNIDFTRLDMNDVERIEIVKGSASAIYGSSAAGGVINIITRSQKEPLTASIDARLSEHHGQRYNALVGVSKGMFSNTFSATHTYQSNYDVHSAADASTRTFSTVFGHSILNFKDKVTFRPTDRLQLSARAGYFFRSIPRTADTPERYRDFSGGMRATWQISKADHIEASYSFDQYDKSDYQRLTHLDIRDYSNVQNALRACYNRTFSTSHHLTLGGDYMHDYLMNANLEGHSRQQDVIDIFAQHDWQIDTHWELLAALRYDYFSDSHESHFTPRLSARYKIDHLTLRANYGMGFRAPALKEKYYNFDIVGIWILKGNASLQPERSHSLNLSGEYSWRNYYLTISAYYNKVLNRITTGLPYTIGNDPQLYMSYRNIPQLHIFNLETTLQAQWQHGFSGKASYAYTNEHNPHAAANQYMPPRQHTANMQLSWQHNWSRVNYRLFSATLSARWYSAVNNLEYIDMYDIEKGTTLIHYPGYALVKLLLNQQFTKRLEFTATIDNLLNYRPKYYYYNAPLTTGINASIGVRLKLF